MPFRDAYKAVAEQLENGTLLHQKKPNTHMKAVSTIYRDYRKMRLAYY
jgi:hypothetical protein